MVLLLHVLRVRIYPLQEKHHQLDEATLSEFGSWWRGLIQTSKNIKRNLIIYHEHLNFEIISNQIIQKLNLLQRSNFDNFSRTQFLINQSDTRQIISIITSYQINWTPTLSKPTGNVIHQLIIKISKYKIQIQNLNRQSRSRHLDVLGSFPILILSQDIDLFAMYRQFMWLAPIKNYYAYRTIKNLSQNKMIWIFLINKNNSEIVSSFQSSYSLNLQSGSRYFA